MEASLSQQSLEPSTERPHAQGAAPVQGLVQGQVSPQLQGQQMFAPIVAASPSQQSGGSTTVQAIAPVLGQAQAPRQAQASKENEGPEEAHGMAEAQSASAKFVGNQSLIKNLQAFVAFACYVAMMQDGKTRTDEVQYDFMADSFHGTLNADGSVLRTSMLQQFLEGQGPFADAWYFADDGVRKLVLLFLNGASYSPACITTKVLSASTQKQVALITGRTLHAFAKAQLAEAKKLVAALYAVCPTGIAASGQSEWDLLVLVRAKYFSEYYVSPARKCVVVDGPCEKKAPQFPLLPVGWSVFVMFGPRSSNPVSLLSSLLDGGSAVPAQSRATLRANQAAKDDAERASGNSNGRAGARGITVGGTLRDAAHVAQNEVSNRQQTVESKIWGLNNQVGIQKELLRSNLAKMGLDYYSRFPEKQEEFAMEIDSAEYHLQRLGEEISELEKQLTLEEPPEVVSFRGSFRDRESQHKRKRPTSSSPGLSATGGESEED